MNNNKKSFDKKWYSEEFLNELKRTAYAEVDGNLTYTAKYAHARRTHRQNGKETKACPGFCPKQYSFKNNREKPRFFQKGLRQDFLCKLSYKRRFNQKQAH